MTLLSWFCVTRRCEDSLFDRSRFDRHCDDLEELSIGYVGIYEQMSDAAGLTIFLPEIVSFIQKECVHLVIADEVDRKHGSGSFRVNNH